MGPIFDTHAHYSAHAFDTDRYALLDSLPDQGVVGVCEQATHSGDAPKVLELAHRYPWVYAAIGIHPESLLAAEDCGEEGPAPTISVYGGDWAAEMKALAPYYDDPKVVAVGECGLDYHWPVPKDAQLALFEAELRLSLELGKPIIVHDRSAHADVYALLKKYQPRGIVHCYSGSADDAVLRLWRGLHVQGCQAGGQGHCGPAAGADRSGNGLPLHGPGARARHPLRQLPHPLCGRVHCGCKRRGTGNRLPRDGRKRQAGLSAVTALPSQALTRQLSQWESQERLYETQKLIFSFCIKQ